MTLKVLSKIILCLTIVRYIESSKLPVVKNSDKFEFDLPSEGLTLSIALKNRATHVPLAKVQFDINERNKKVVMSGNKQEVSNVLSLVDNRHGIVVGTCPLGYTRRGEFCIKDDYDYS